MKQKLKVRMQGALLRAFAAGQLSDDQVRAQGYDPEEVRARHRIGPPRAGGPTVGGRSMKDWEKFLDDARAGRPAKLTVYPTDEDLRNATPKKVKALVQRAINEAKSN
jgi:hypothetical protein